MDPDTIWNAIFGQESNYGRNTSTSVTGAIGPGQIQPETWMQYAQPGENIRNYNDNIAVSKRIVQDYYNRYGGDPAKIATAYFSGPGNVSQSGATPYRQNKTDPTGKSVASYVSDISNRLKMASADNFDPETAFGQWEKPAAVAAPAQAKAFDPEAAFSQWEKPTAAAVQPMTAQSASRIPIPTENMTPQQLAEYQAGLQRGREGPPSWLTSNYNPLAAIPATVGAGTQQIGQGLQDIKSGRVATGIGNLFGGTVGTVLGPLLGPYSETTRAFGQAIGQPQAGEVAGLVIPTRGIGSVAKSALPSARTASELVKLVGEENIPTVLQKLQANPNLSLMDISEPVRTVAAGLANSPRTPEAQNIMRSAYEARTSARQDIVQKAIDEKLGPPLDVKAVSDQLSKNLSDVGKQRINPALEGAQPVGVMPIVQRLDSVISSPAITDATKNELTRIRKQIAAEGPDAFLDPQKLHNIQWPIRALAENLSKSTSGLERSMSGPIMAVRNDIVDAIDVASGGKYKPALSQYRDAAMVPEAVDRGFNILKQGGIEDFPEYWRDWASKASPQEIMGARVGAISAIRQTIEGMKSGAMRGEGILTPTFVQDRFSSIFPPNQVRELQGLLSDAKNMAETNALLFRNSKTAQVTAGQKYFEPREVGAPAGKVAALGTGAAGAMMSAVGYPEAGAAALLLGGLKGAHTGLQYLGSLTDKATATKFAKLVSASEGPKRNELLNLLSSAQAARGGNKLQNLTSSLVRLAAP